MRQPYFGASQRRVQEQTPIERAQTQYYKILGCYVCVQRIYMHVTFLN